MELSIEKLRQSCGLYFENQVKLVHLYFFILHFLGQHGSRSTQVFNLLTELELANSNEEQDYEVNSIKEFIQCLISILHNQFRQGLSP